MMTACPSPPLAAAPLAVTMGEPAGIGGELTIKAFLAARRDPSEAADTSETKVPPFFAIDDPARLRRIAEDLGADVAVREIAAPSETVALWPRALPVLPLTVPAAVTPGCPTSANAEAVLEAIGRAVAAALDGDAGGVVTHPINKQVLIAAGFTHTGHTDFIAALARAHRPHSVPRGAVMMMAAPGLRVVPVTVHMGLRQAIAALSADAIVDCGHVLHDALQARYAIAAPRIAVAGLNPHAGEAGLFGDEETAIIAPALARLAADGIATTGPLPADSLFSDTNRRRFDAMICMYHDQALIPVKTLDFWHTVNVTLGLPFVRTSPAHGTGLDIAGSGTANPSSFIAALQEAARTPVGASAHAAAPGRRP